MLVEIVDAPLNCFPAVVDNSMRTEFVSCPQSCFRKYIQGYVPVAESVHLVAGKAYAKGLEVARRAFYEQGMAEDDAVAEGYSACLREYGDFEPPEKSNKTALRMAQAIVYHLSQYPLSQDAYTPVISADGKAMVEFSFILPLPLNNPDTGEPLLYSGRFDMLAESRGEKYGFDDKTASQLGSTWGKKWELASQFSGYTWGAREHGFNLAGFVIRGISILKEKYGMEQPIVYRPQWMLDMWYEQMIRDFTRMINTYVEWKKTGRRQEWDYDLNDACSAYGGCAYFTLCTSRDPDPWLTNYVIRKYDPSAIGE